MTARIHPRKQVRKERADGRLVDTHMRGCGHRHNTNGYERCLMVNGAPTMAEVTA